jgi:hypothetical protein
VGFFIVPPRLPVATRTDSLMKQKTRLTGMGNMKTKMIALLIAGGIAFTPVAASAQVCGIGIIIAAMAANAQQGRELTAKEAATCGLMLGHDQQNVKGKKHAHKSKHRKTAKHKG